MLPRLILVFLSVDWPTFSRRPMLSALAKTAKEYRTTVVAVNRPLCPVSTLFRKPSRLVELLKKPTLSVVSENLYLYSPKYFLHDSWAQRLPLFERLNLFALRRSLASLQRRLQLAEDAPIVWYYYPQQGFVSKLFEKSFNIYEIYDSLADIYGNRRITLEESEVRLRTLVDLVITTSRTLHSLYSIHYRNSFELGNGLARKHFEQLSASKVGTHPILNDIGRPRLGYCGALSARLNWDLIRGIADMRPDWNLIFVGPRLGAVPDALLADFKNIHLLDAVEYEQLPSLFRSLDIGIMPYLDNPFFQALNPLKFYEYAAAGIPCVSSPIPELERFNQSFVRVCDNTPQAWVKAISEHLDADVIANRETGTKIASNYIWEDMIAKLFKHLESLIRAKQ